MDTITRFRGPYSFMSNFASVPIVYESKPYSSVEYAYQAAKFADDAMKDEIANSPKPKTLANLYKHLWRDDWDDIKLAVMEELLRQKFDCEPFRTKLLNTQNAVLMEGNTWGDKYWGVVYYDGEWLGENHLGKLLMKIRSDLQ